MQRPDLKIHLIVNPTAGRGLALRQLPEIESRLQSSGCNFKTAMTRHRGDARAIASVAIKEGFDIVVAVGGDGTLHEVSNAVIDAPSDCGVTLGLIAMGTGNDFARCVGLEGTIEHKCNTIVFGERHFVDIGVIEGAGLAPTRFLVAAGTGYIADTAATVNRGIRFISGMPAYIIGAIMTLKSFKPSKMVVTFDDALPRSVQAMLISISNVATTGGGMKIAPGALCDDGLFEICLVHSINKWVLLRQLPNVIKGLHIHHPSVQMLSASRIRLESEIPLDLWIDGEVSGTTPALISMEPARLPIMLPKLA